MTGWLKIIGIGPGGEELITPQVTSVIKEATDAVGYYPYIARISHFKHLRQHPSDNREEIARSKQAIKLAIEGNNVVIVSSGDPGIFAMAAAVFEAVEFGPLQWKKLDIEVLPGITAMLAAAAKIGAPLGHDFCVINLSDNLKPWYLIELRLTKAIEADFAITIYNPRSISRPQGLKKTLTLFKKMCSKDRPIIFARAVCTPQEEIKIVALDDSSPDMADMLTLVILGSSQTRLIPRNNQPPLVYTPRSFVS